MNGLVRKFMTRRREERELRLRMRRVIASGFVPVADEPIELPSEPIDLATGRARLERRRKARG
ncbi:MAG TPA: hypothetical protein VMZ28_28265 [Kofleriaceae bacterium]|nr:hypothetical protein [Kofleriaceae bacterium]